MNKEEAINILNDYDINFERNTAEEVAEAHEIAIEALKTQPCEDCVSRKAVLDGLHSYFAEGFNEDRWWNSTYVLDVINKVPSVNPQPKKEDTSDRKIGFWIEHNNALGISHIECPECSCWFLKRDLPHNSYCPNCGSRNHWEYELKWMEVKNG